MTTASITKTLKKIENCKENYSTHFKRIHFLPVRVRKALNVTFIVRLRNEGKKITAANVNESINSFFANMSSDEYINFLKQA